MWAEQGEDEQKDSNYPMILGIAAFLTVLGYYLRVQSLEQNNLTANRVLHNRMMENITRVPLTFFDSNPSGQILNKFSTDMFMMNDLLQWFMTDFANCWVMILGNFIMTAVISPWISIIVVLVVVNIFLIVRKIAPATGEFRKLELQSKAPGYTLLN